MRRAATSLLATTLALLIALPFALLLLLLPFARTWRYPALWPQAWQRSHCGGAVKVSASIEDLAVIKKILDHLNRRAGPEGTRLTAHPVLRTDARLA